MPATGVQQQYWVKEEATFDTALAETATDAVNLIELSIEPEMNFDKTIEHTGTASLQNEIEGKRGGKWTAVSYIMPVSVGTEPDAGPFFKAAMGSVSGSDYSLTDSQTSIPTLQIIKYAGDNLYEIINGCWVEEMSIESVGGSAPKVTFSGGFASYGWCYGGATVSSGSGTSVTLNADHGNRVGVNSLVKFDTEDNSGAGYRVTAVSGDVLTISPTLAGPVSASDAVAPVVTTQTLTGTIQGGISGDLTIAGTSVGVISYKMTLSTGVKGLDQEATSNRANRVVRVAREVSGECQFYFLESEDSTELLGRAWYDTQIALVHRIGPATAGSRLTITTPSVRFNVSQIETPESDEAVWSGTFMARQSAAAADELSVDFD